MSEWLIIVIILVCSVFIVELSVTVACCPSAGRGTVLRR